MKQLESMFDRAILARLDQEPELVDRLIDTAFRMALDGNFQWWCMLADRIDALDDQATAQATHQATEAVMLRWVI